MTDDEKLTVALVARGDGKPQETLTVGDVVAMLSELGALYRRAQAETHLAAAVACSRRTRRCAVCVPGEDFRLGRVGGGPADEVEGAEDVSTFGAFRRDCA